MFNDFSSPIRYCLTRRSAKPRDLIAPGPDAGQIQQILTAAMRTPDHGKLAPWRFVIIGADQREALAERLTTAYRAEKPEAGRLEIEAMAQFAHQAPALVVALSSPAEDSKIPLWEQELSAGAACMNLLHAATALGFGGGWLTGWPTYNSDVRDAFGHAPEKIAGFLFLGTPSRPLEERPRPDYDERVSVWDI
ncbi:MAG: nitroreductase [Alphaproteobacteria bacterium]|nr:nitroreductase [Alphaproteobacteria bacterium]